MVYAVGAVLALSRYDVRCIERQGDKALPSTNISRTPGSNCISIAYGKVVKCRRTNRRTQWAFVSYQ